MCTEVMTQWLRTPAALAEDTGSVASTHIAKQLTTTYAVPVPGDLLFSSDPPQVPGMQVVHIHTCR